MSEFCYVIDCCKMYRMAGNQNQFSAVEKEASTALLLGIFLILCSYVYHGNWVASRVYSNPSIVLTAETRNRQVLFDDFREAYTWLKHNTAIDARVMSWWDYGYQISTMADKITIVDNSAWNDTHIATIGMPLRCEACIRILKIVIAN